MDAARTIRVRTCWLALATLAVVMSGCATVEKKPEMRFVWPPPPEKARIEFVRSIVSDEDLEKDTTFSQRLVAFLAGDKPTSHRIVEPMGVAVSDDGERVYVADYAQLAVFVFDFRHKAFTKIGEKAPLERPAGIALDAEERLYIVEQAKKGVTAIDRTGAQVQFISHPSLERPVGIALDRKRGRIYVADSGHSKSEEHTVKIFDLSGALVGRLGGERGTEPGHFLFPTYVAVDGDGNVYVTDTLNSRIQVFDAEGKYLKSFGQRGNGWGMFDKPKGVALDSFGNVYVVDSGWSNVQIFNQKGQILLPFGGRGPLPGMLKNPTAIAIDGKNHIYVADYLNHRVEMYQLVNTTAADSLISLPEEAGGGDTGKTKQAETSALQRAEGTVIKGGVAQ